MFDDATPPLPGPHGGAPGVSAGTPPGAEGREPDGPDGLVGIVGLGGLSDQDLEAELATHAAHLAAAECRFCLMAAEVDRRGFWSAQGATSAAHWLAWRCSMSAGVAREHVRVGRALAELPLLCRAFARGELSFSKVRALTRIATPQMEELLLQMAACATASQLETIVRGFRRASPEEGTRALEQRRGRFLHSVVDRDGMVVLTARLSPEDGATVLAAVEAVHESLAADEETCASPPAEPDTTPTEPHAARRADALARICEAALARGVVLPAAYGPHASVVVHVDERVLVDNAAEGCAHVEGVGVVSAHTVQRLACDASISTVRFRADGTCVPEGSTRRIPLGLRRAVLARDHGCRWPGCDRRRHVQVHHVTWVSKNGRTRLDNLVVLCGRHHHLAHEGGFRLSMDRHCRVHVVAPDGRELPPGRPLPGAAGDSLFARHAADGLRLDATSMPTGGEPYDLDLTIDVLLAAARPDGAGGVSGTEGSE